MDVIAVAMGGGGMAKDISPSICFYTPHILVVRGAKFER